MWMISVKIFLDKFQTPLSIRYWIIRMKCYPPFSFNWRKKEHHVNEAKYSKTMFAMKKKRLSLMRSPNSINFISSLTVKFHRTLTAIIANTTIRKLIVASQRERTWTWTQTGTGTTTVVNLTTLPLWSFAWVLLHGQHHGIIHAEQ